jgi:hypothetical protein
MAETSAIDNLIDNRQMRKPAAIADCHRIDFAIIDCPSGLSIADFSAIADCRLPIID